MSGKLSGSNVEKRGIDQQRSKWSEKHWQLVSLWKTKRQEKGKITKQTGIGKECADMLGNRRAT